MDRRTLGIDAEAQAREYLRLQGLEIFETNFRCKVGELDLIARDGKVLVVIEVRSRLNMGYGNAAASIDWRKRARIVRATQFFLLKRKDLRRLPVRFDVVTLDRSAPDAKPTINWIRGAFTTDS